MEKYVISFINSMRNERNLKSLYPHHDLGVEAKKHSRFMKQTGEVANSKQFPEKDELTIHHRFETDNTWAELRGMFDGLAGDESCRKILLTPGYTHVGIGIEIDAGQIWLTLRFVKIE